MKEYRTAFVCLVNIFRIYGIKMEDIKVTENEDGSFTLEWNKNNPQWSFLNDMTQEELADFVNQAIENLINKVENNDKIS